jgi:hypothetical protein
VVPFSKGWGSREGIWPEISGGPPFFLLPMPFESEPDACGGVVVEQLGIADVAADHADRAVASLLHDERSLLPALAAALARPERREWPAKSMGSKSALRAQRLTMSATL